MARIPPRPPAVRHASAPYGVLARRVQCERAAARDAGRPRSRPPVCPRRAHWRIAMIIIWLAALGASIVVALLIAFMYIAARGKRPALDVVARWALRLWVFNFVL